MDLGATEIALTTWVETHSGLELEWGLQPQKLHTGPFVLAYLGPITKVGHDERIQSYNVGDDSTSVRVVGVRRFPLRLSFRAFDQSLGGSARSYAETFRARAHEQESFDFLRTSEISFNDTSNLVDVDYEWSNRLVSQTELTVYLELRSDVTDELHDGSYIGTVNAEPVPYIVDEEGTPVIDNDGDFLTQEP
jgi:hypothetical protein